MSDDIPTTRETLRSLAHRIANTNPANTVLDGFLLRSGPVVVKRLIEEAASLAKHEFGSRDKLVQKLSDLSKRKLVSSSDTAPQLWAYQAIECIGEVISKLDQRELRPDEDAIDASPAKTRSVRRRFDERYISEARIAELRLVRRAKYDPARLIRILEEMNSAAAAECWISVAALVRVVLDHVPPVFGYETFAQLAAHADGRIPSWKQTLVSLQETSRKIADHHLHKKIEAHESLPAFQQIDNRKELDQLLERVVVELRLSAKGDQTP